MNLTQALKVMVIQQCRVRGVQPEQIGNGDAVIGGQGVLQLDSLDAVEIVTCLERNLGLKADSMPLKNMFRSFDELASYVQSQVTPEKLITFIDQYKK